ncbi:hypothetical protein BDN71DRAFT_1433220 [Pleurotus eryngii]|uniref:Uncharacterized protein n=1 Tax=Pleurotus eryngii TaxID=5323 RepID=A0A9P5ZR48_PLEER|nr:hypothetical protein BDN71DRAFT_1433220 [Pleurotus eryngii]
MVRQVRHDDQYLSPMGSFRAEYGAAETPKAKIIFELDKPDNPSFAKDFLTAMDVLKAIQVKGKKYDIQKDMVGTNEQVPYLRVVVPLFRKKAFKGEEQELPDGPIEDDPSKPNYYPTASNWPAGKECAEFMEMALNTHIFQPFHTFWLNKGRINPKEFCDTLPGCLVKVMFTTHVRHPPKTKVDPFNARAKQCIILQPLLFEEEPMIETKKVISRGITYPGQPTIASFLKAGNSSSAPKRRLNEMEGSSNHVNTQEGVIDDEVQEIISLKKQKLADTANVADGPSDKGKGKEVQSNV